MATGIKLSEPQLRALRILSQHDEVRESNKTSEDYPPRIYWKVADSLDMKWLAQLVARGDQPRRWRIRSKGRQVLAEHDAGGG